MARGRLKTQMVLSPQERERLAMLARSRSLPSSLTRRAQVILCVADGESNRAMAQRMWLSESTVGRWCARFLEHRVDGLYDLPRPGRPPALESERIGMLAEMIRCGPPAEGSAEWTVRALAEATGIPKSTVQRYLKSHAIGRRRGR